MGCASSSQPGEYKVRQRSPHARFDRIKTMGMGASCTVVSVYDVKDKRLFAMKVMDKTGPSAVQNSMFFKQELRILSQLKHPNIVEFVEAFEDGTHHYLVTVLCTGGELFDRVKYGSFTEKVASRLSQEMISAMAYLHAHNVVHRDLKPENFVFETKDPDSKMKLIDFGCALKVVPSKVVPDIAGSRYYIAPECLDQHCVRTGESWRASDMWSVGVIIYLLTHGYPPFDGKSDKIIFRKIRRGEVRFSRKISQPVKDLLKKLLVVDWRKRLTAEQALQHPWITGELATDTLISKQVVTNMNAFRKQCRLKKAVGRVMANYMTESDREHLLKAFREFDSNGDGELSWMEVHEMMKRLGRTEEEAKEFFEQMDTDGDGTVSLQEFTTSYATNTVLSANREQDIRKAFEMFDKNGDGVVSAQEIEEMCTFLTKEAVQQLIAEVDKNGDGEISFDEWLAAMKDINLKKVKTLSFTAVSAGHVSVPGQTDP